VAGAGRGFALVWLDLTASGRSLRRAWVDTLGAPHPRAGLAVTAPEVYAADPALAAAAGGVTLAWRVPLPADEDDLLAARWALEDTSSASAPRWLTAVAGATLHAGPANRSPFLAAPNPFRRDVLVRHGEASCPLLVVDARGRLVRTLPAASPGSWIWDGRDDAGARAPAGVYLAHRPGEAGAVRLVRLP
jgi:hypothetical protein